MASKTHSVEERLTGLLKNNNLSVTEGRKTILRVFFENEAAALRPAELETQLPNLDRVTIYRTLQAFDEKGILHTVPGSDGTLRYALCKAGCDEHHHHDEHVHFVCRKCGATQCLDDVHIPLVKIPQGFTAEKSVMMVTGICGRCQS